MMGGDSVGFILDEHVPLAILLALRTVEPSLRAMLIGISPEAPPKGTFDADVLDYAQAEKLAVVTFDKETMPGHAWDHYAAGKHTWGIFIFPRGRNLSAGQIVESLVTVWATSDADEWVDRIEYLPYR